MDPRPPARLTKWLIFITVLLWGLQILVSNQLATAGSELRQLEDRIQELKGSNQKLEQEVTEKTSLDYLTKSAEEKGLVWSPGLITLK